MKTIKNRGKKIIFLIAIFQILLFICLTPAESYSIHQTDSAFNNEVIINKNNDFGDKVKDILGTGVNLLIGFLSINEIGFVSAATVTTSCCTETCSDVISSYTGCSKELVPTTCANTAECRKGCCYDPVEGLCSANSPKGKCESNGGEWSSDIVCSTSKCKKGCCVVGSNAKFTTNQQCSKLAEVNGVEKDFRQQIQTELSCLALTATNFEGACVLNGKNCKFESEKQCLYDGGTFHQDYLCSNPELDTKCTKQASINCASGKNEIYWFDSCGNRENIYSSDKTASWNNGKVLAKSDSCGGIGVMGSTSCGNCKQSLSTCSATMATETHVVAGNFVCKDLGCENAIANVGTQDRLNGEKWCLYDGSIGDGKAVVGSEHWIASCYRGEVKVERCGDYRSSVCQQYVINDQNVKFSTASCVVNYATECISITQNYFGKSELASECNKNEHCMIRSVNAGSNFQFSMCVGKYPKGDDLTDGLDGNTCSLGSQSCTMVFESKGFNNWDCIANCECDDPTFAQQMNELCMSIGDCGSNVNYLGKGTNNVQIVGKIGKKIDSDGKEIADKDSTFGASAPGIYSWTNYIGNAKSVAGQYVEGKDFSEEAAVAFGINDYDVSDNVGVVDTVGTVAGGIGTVIAGGAAMGIIDMTTLVSSYAGTSLTFAGSFFTVVAAAAAGMYLGGVIGRALGKSPSQMAWLIAMGGVAGAGVGIIMISSGAGFCSTGYGCIIGIGLIIIALLYFLWSWLSGAGERETRVIEFTCQPWTAPNGGDNCEKCNDNPLRPCTAYRCSSLGQLCEIVNEGYESPECISLPKESNPPIISAGEVKTSGYKFQNEVSDSVEVIRSLAGEKCIDEYNSISFTLKTDEYAQCKYSFEIPGVPGYEEMEGDYPVEENLFGKTHTFSFIVPGIDDKSVEMTEETTDSNGAIVKYGDLNLYVKCKDKQDPANYNIKEYGVKMCVRSGPDITLVNFNEVITNPENGAVLKFGATDADVTFGINEPANCKYDTAAGMGYDEMQYSMTCKTGINDAGMNGWPCTAKIENLIEGENKLYFRCRDMSGNTNDEDFVYTLTTSKSELKIDSVNFIYGTKKIGFGGTIKTGIEPASIDVEVKTSGGGYEGKSYCLWGVSEKGYRWLMSPFDNAALVHDQTIVGMEGIHMLYIDCQDDAGNEVSASGEFVLDVDNTPPIVIRAYKEGDKLKIVTDELARCYYNPNTCIFDIDSTSANSMNPSFSTSHTAPWNPGIVYYIRCKDVFGNAGDCTKEISPS